MQVPHPLQRPLLPLPALQDVRSGLFGALGISRRKELAFKPLQYPRLSDLIRDFLDSYGKWWHRVTKVREPCAMATLVVADSDSVRCLLATARGRNTRRSPRRRSGAHRSARGAQRVLRGSSVLAVLPRGPCEAAVGRSRGTDRHARV